jgi:DNA-binding PadR family transcriptional regulator
MWPLSWRLHRRRGLRYWILPLLARGPKNGAEIMNSIEELTQGWWRPSPGSIYPLLEGLEQEGLVKKGPDGKYTLSEKSRSELEWPAGMPGGPPQNVEGMLREIKGYVSYFEDVSKSERARITPHADEIRKIADRLLALVQERGEKA